MEEALRNLYDMIDDLQIAMFTTRRADGHLVSRAMATQERAPGADLWFVTSSETDKLDELEEDPHVNLAYYKDRTREWISVSGTAEISRDRATIHRLFGESWRAWFTEEGDPRHGTPDDPRIVLIGVHVHSAVYFESKKPQPVVLYEMAKGWFSGKMPDVGSVRHVER
jgi:general stress protein 26